METIRELRESKGWTQQELADKTGVSRQTISKLENGHELDPRKSTLLLLAMAFGIDPQELMNGYRTKKEAVNE
jgi:transcriptional regulator with XRE-family HTH domain